MKHERIAIVGVDLAKHVFQIHGVDARGVVKFRRRLSRAEVIPFFRELSSCLVGMEACGGAHHWAREIRALGHTVRLMTPQSVKPYVRTNKDDRADAEAIAESVGRPRMRFVAIKEVWQQELLMVHRVRERRVRARTALMNEIRGLLQEYGIVFPQGSARLREGLLQLLGSTDGQLSDLMRSVVQRLVEEWSEIERFLEGDEAMIMEAYRSKQMCRRLGEVPGVGPITATALVATVGDVSVFKNGRQLSAFLGLVPRHDGTGGRNRMKGISKRGDRYVRKLLVHGARAVLRGAVVKPSPRHRWVTALSERRGFNKACVALANKNARRCFAIMACREPMEGAAVRSAHGERVIHSAFGNRAPGCTGNPRAVSDALWITLGDDSMCRSGRPQSSPLIAGIRCDPASGEFQEGNRTGDEVLPDPAKARLVKTM